MNLYSKVSITVFISLALVVGSITYIISSQRMSEAKEHMVKQAEFISTFMAKEIALDYSESRWPLEILHDISEREGFLFWWIVKDNGTVYLADKASFVGTDVHEYFPEMGKIRRQTFLNLDRNYGISCQLLQLRQKKWSFWFGFSLDGIYQARKRIILTGLGVSFVVLICFNLMLFLVIRPFFKPIDKLIAGALQIGKGNLSYRVKIETRDELAQIAISFNKMAGALQATMLSKDYVDNIMNNLMDSLIVVTPEGKIKTANLPACTLLGYGPQEITELPIETILYEEKLQKIFQGKGLQALIGAGAVKELEAHLLTRKGAKIPVLFSVLVMRNSDHTVQGIICVASNISQLKRSEQELRDSEEKFRSMMESMIDPISICSSNFIIVYMNPEMIKQVGRDAVGEKCFTALHGLDTRCKWCPIERVMNGESFEIKIVSPRDNRTYRVSHMPLYNPDGTVSKMSLYRDITDYLAAVAENEKAQKLLSQGQKMEAIGNLAGGIAHDFNNILAAVMGYAELALHSAEKGSTLEDDINEILKASNRAKELVWQVLTFSRQAEEEIHPVRVSVIAKEVLKFIRSSIPSSIEIMPDIKSKSTIMGNSTQIHQILLNLCTNAAHAIGNESGVLKIRLEDIVITAGSSGSELGLKPGDYIKLSVSDTGAGIAPDIIGSIFDPYFTTKEKGEGTGLGLAVVHGIVEKYNGRIFVESTLGRGSVFTIYLPICQTEKITRNEKTDKIPSGRERILFVDDEPTLVEIGKRTLESLGYFVTVRTSSIEALALFKARPDEFDVVITDMTMPNMNGDKLAVELMKIRSEIPVILCTGFSRSISEKYALEIGIKALVYKPFVKEVFAKTIREVI